MLTVAFKAGESTPEGVVSHTRSVVTLIVLSSVKAGVMYVLNFAGSRHIIFVK